MACPDLDVQSLAIVSEGALSQAEGMAQDRAEQWLMADQMVVGLPASQLQGWAPSVTQRRAQPERPIDERELAGLMGRALRLAVGRIGTGDEGDSPRSKTARPLPGGHRERGDPAWRLVDSAVVALSVDDHGVTDPVGFKGRDFGATVFTAVAQSGTIDTWCEVARRLEFSALTLAAAPLALAAGLAEPRLVSDRRGRQDDRSDLQSGRPAGGDRFAVQRRGRAGSDADSEVGGNTR